MVNVFYSGKKKVFALTTLSGSSIKASGNHPFLQKKGWTALEQLKKGDEIGLSLPPYRPSSLTSKPLQKEGSLLCEDKKLSVYWDEICDIVELGIEDVYDATVENVHNFVANDLIVHNSIEQDSDIVLFLLRREYYDPYDKPGLAELIVAKNRHGAVGTINMTYRKEIAQFANYSSINSSSTASEEAFSAFSP